MVVLPPTREEEYINIAEIIIQTSDFCMILPSQSRQTYYKQTSIPVRSVYTAISCSNNGEGIVPDTPFYGNSGH